MEGGLQVLETDLRISHSLMEETSRYRNKFLETDFKRSHEESQVSGNERH
jgi:hypothetical protein